MNTRTVQKLVGGSLLLGVAASCSLSGADDRARAETELTGEASQALAFQITCPKGVPTPPAPDLHIDKTVVAHGAPCPGVDPYVTPLGSQVDYCLAISNDSGQAVHNLNAVDDNGTFNYTFLNQLLIAAGLSDANGDGQPDTLSPGQSVSIQYGPIVFSDADGTLVTNDIVRVSFTFSASSTASCLAYYTDSSTVIDGPACAQQPALCDDGDACTTDACDALAGCTHEAVSCNDGDACTTDSCDALTGCGHAPVSCDDGNACTSESCDALTGCSSAPVSCDDGDACTAESCDALTGCAHAPVSCDDGSACTADSCDALTGCGHAPVSCDDGNACTADSCDALTGCAHAPVSCDDGDYTTADSCNPAIGCVHDDISCDDGSACTTDVINPDGSCGHAPVSCDDGNACTADSCDPATGCGHAPLSCNDGDACTADACDPGLGCTHTPLACGTGATRTIGYYANHPSIITQCLAARGGLIDLGFVKLRNEVADDEIDVDVDGRVETGLMLSLGVLKCNVAKYRNGSARSPLAKARIKAGQQMIAALCNHTLTGASPSFDLDAAVATLAGTDVAAINAINSAADAFNNSKDSVPLGFSNGPADAKAAWDDPTDGGD